MRSADAVHKTASIAVLHSGAAREVRHMDVPNASRVVSSFLPLITRSRIDTRVKGHQRQQIDGNGLSYLSPAIDPNRV